MKDKLIDKFLEFEKKNNLFNQKIAGIQAWSLVRFIIYSKVEASEKGYSARTQADKDINFLKWVTKFLNILLNTAKYYIERNSSTDLIFIGHSRRKKVGNSYVDIYTDPLKKLLNMPHQTFEPMFELGHKKPPVTENIHYLDAIEFWSKLISFVWKKRIISTEREYWKTIELSIKDEFGIEDIDLISILELEISRFFLMKLGLTRLLQKVKPRLIIQVVSYHRINMAINIIAKTLKIPTAELQHGYIGDKHIAYNYPVECDIKTFPDYLLLWGDYWKKQINAPIEENKLVTTGFAYFNEKRNEYLKKECKTKKQILFISQGTIGPELSKEALRLTYLDEFRHFEIMFKLHPSEYSESKKRYTTLYNNRRITVLDDHDSEDLYKWMIESVLIVGVYSTALIEAAGLGKKIYVLKIPGWEAMEKLIEEGEIDISLIQNIEELELVDQKVNNYNDSNYLFSQNCYNWLNSFCSEQNN